jgi:DNA-binding MarR family transcriptional regulator
MLISDQLDSALREWVKVFTHRSMQEFHRSQRDYGLSTGQLRTLTHLHFHGVHQVSDIGDDLGVTAAAASQLVDRLVSMDLLERTEDPNDRRVKRITISEAGRALVRQGIEDRLKWMKDLANNLSPVQQEEIISALRTLTDAANSLEGKQQEDELETQRTKV